MLLEATGCELDLLEILQTASRVDVIKYQRLTLFRPVAWIRVIAQLCALSTVQVASCPLYCSVTTDDSNTLRFFPHQVWCLAVSSHGEFVVTGSHDRSLRRWERTEEPFFVEEEREKRLESMFEAGIENAADDRGGDPGNDTAEGAVGAAGRRTQETISAADSIIEALEMAELETQRVLEHRVSSANRASKEAVGWLRVN